MTEIYDVYVYSLPDCPRCELLKEALTKSEIPFSTYNMEEAATLTELKLEGCFSMEAPVLAKVIHKEGVEPLYTFWYGEDLFPQGQLDDTELAEMIRNG